MAEKLQYKTRMVKTFTVAENMKLTVKDVIFKVKVEISIQTLAKNPDFEIHQVGNRFISDYFARPYILFTYLNVYIYKKLDF